MASARGALAPRAGRHEASGEWICRTPRRAPARHRPFAPPCGGGFRRRSGSSLEPSRHRGRGIDALGHAAVAGEESMARSGMAGAAAKSSIMATAVPASASLGESCQRDQVGFGDTPSTLNIDPMPPRPPPTSRFSAPKCPRRPHGRPSPSGRPRGLDAEPFRKSPCGTGPWTRAPRSSAARASA